MARIKRKRLLVDTKVQGALAFRVCLYWLLCVVGTTAALLCWRIVVSGPARYFYLHLDDLWFDYGPVLLTLFGLLLLIVYDMVRLSHRFAGPVFRLGNCMRRLARGEPVEPIHFRKGDMWQELADEFNAVSALVQQLQRQNQTHAASALERVSSQTASLPEAVVQG